MGYMIAKLRERNLFLSSEDTSGSACSRTKSSTPCLMPEFRSILQVSDVVAPPPMRRKIDLCSKRSEVSPFRGEILYHDNEVPIVAAVVFDVFFNTGFLVEIEFSRGLDGNVFDSGHEFGHEFLYSQV